MDVQTRTTPDRRSGGDPRLLARCRSPNQHVVVAGGPIGQFSIVKAIASLAGAATAKAEVAKLTKQFGAAKVALFVTVQNFAVDDAVKRAAAADVKFPAPMLKGAVLAKRVTLLGLVNGTYYEGTSIDFYTNKLGLISTTSLSKTTGRSSASSDRCSGSSRSVALASSLVVLRSCT